MSPLRIAFLLVVHAIPVVYLLRGGLTPLDVLLLSWAEGFVAILLNRIRLAGIEIRAVQSGSGRKHLGKRLRVLAELARSVAMGAALYAFLGAFALLAIFIIAGKGPIPWSISGEAFWAAGGWMALAAAVETVASVFRVERQSGAPAFLDERTRLLMLRFLADQMLLVSAAFLVIFAGAGTLAVVMLVALKVAVDITAESWAAARARTKGTVD